MFRLKSNGLKWLKGFHLIAVSSWIGGALSLILINAAAVKLTNAKQ